MKTAVGGAVGFGLGLTVAIWFWIFGVLLCLTGIGAIIGIPLIIGGVLLLPAMGAVGAKAARQVPRKTPSVQTSRKHDGGTC